MLVLTRKPQEKIQIGDGITITVIKTKGQGVRLGIEAPSDVSILRGELVAANESFRDDSAATDPETAEAGPLQEAEGCVESPGAEVQFARVSRSRVPSVLPDLLGDAGPLRAMLNQREGSRV